MFTYQNYTKIQGPINIKFWTSYFTCPFVCAENSISTIRIQNASSIRRNHFIDSNRVTVSDPFVIASSRVHFSIRNMKSVTRAYRCRLSRKARRGVVLKPMTAATRRLAST